MAGVAELKRFRWNLRVGADADTLVRAAASERDQSLTDFVLTSALTEAEHVLADRTRFAVGDDAWSELLELLDRPVHANPGLAKLFATANVFE